MIGVYQASAHITSFKELLLGLILALPPPRYSCMDSLKTEHRGDAEGCSYLLPHRRSAWCLLGMVPGPQIPPASCQARRGQMGIEAKLWDR